MWGLIELFLYILRLFCACYSLAANGVRIVNRRHYKPVFAIPFFCENVLRRVFLKDDAETSKVNPPFIFYNTNEN